MPYSGGGGRLLVMVEIIVGIARHRQFFHGSDRPRVRSNSEREDFLKTQPSHRLFWLGFSLRLSALGPVGIRAFQSDEAKSKRLGLKRQKEVRALTQKISTYARSVHQRFPAGDVAVSERDLAEQLRKRTEWSSPRSIGRLSELL